MVGYAFVHTAIDSHTRLAYSEVLPDEKAVTAVGFYQRAHAWFAELGVVIEVVQTDNGACYKLNFKPHGKLFRVHCIKRCETSCVCSHSTRDSSNIPRIQYAIVIVIFA